MSFLKKAFAFSVKKKLFHCFPFFFLSIRKTVYLNFIFSKDRKCWGLLSPCLDSMLRKSWFLMDFIIWLQISASACREKSITVFFLECSLPCCSCSLSSSPENRHFNSFHGRLFFLFYFCWLCVYVSSSLMFLCQKGLYCHDRQLGFWHCIRNDRIKGGSSILQNQISGCVWLKGVKLKYNWIEVF